MTARVSFGALLFALGLTACMLTGNTQALSLKNDHGQPTLAHSVIGEHYDKVIPRAVMAYGMEPQCEQRKIGLQKTRKAYSYTICSFLPPQAEFAGAPVGEVVYHFIEMELARVEISLSGEQEKVMQLQHDIDDAFGAAQNVEQSTSPMSYIWPGKFATLGLRQGGAAAAGNVYLRLFETALAVEVPWLGAE